MARKRFSDADYQTMAARREAGLTCAAIAREFGCSVGLVTWTCLRLGADLPNARPLDDAIAGPPIMRRGGHVVRRFLPEEDSRLVELARDGERRSAIARALGRRRNSVVGRLMTLARRAARREAAHG